mgnify:CR=1 FL=1
MTAHVAPAKSRPAAGIPLAALAAALLIAASAAAPALADTLSMPASGASRIVFALPGDLVVRQGQQEQVTVEAEGSVLPKLDIGVRGDTLVLASKGSFRTSKPMKIAVTLKALRSFASRGSGDAAVEGFSGETMEFESAGSGELQLRDIRAGRLALAIKGSGDIAASGAGNFLAARIAGTGAIDAARYRVRSAQAEISGSGDIKVNAEQSLEASISGAGNIGYRGQPRVKESVSGAGSVDRL